MKITMRDQKMIMQAETVGRPGSLMYERSSNIWPQVTRHGSLFQSGFGEEPLMRLTWANEDFLDYRAGRKIHSEHYAVGDVFGLEHFGAGFGIWRRRALVEKGRVNVAR